MRLQRIKFGKALPSCAICGGPMKLIRTIPAAWILPELRSYRCEACANIRTVEREIELQNREPLKRLLA